MAGVVRKSFEEPDETRTPEKTNLAIVNIGSVSASRMTAQPGWRWSECIKPVAGTDSCQAHHVGACQSGRLAIRHEDGTEAEIGPGDVYEVQPGHDAWVVGDEPFVAYEFDSRTVQEFAAGS